MHGMSFRRPIAALLFSVSTIALAPATAHAASDLVGIGDLDGSSFESISLGLSGDGSTVVGFGHSDNGHEAFRWTLGGSMEGLGDLAGGVFSSKAFAASDDGSVVIGRGTSADGLEAFRWTSGGGMVGLGGLQAPNLGSAAYGTNADGSVVVGTSLTDAGSEAFRWTGGGGMVGLGDLAGGRFESFALDVSADGSIIVGAGTSADGQEAFRWTAGTGMVGLGDLEGSFFGSVAKAVSADGSAIVGQGISRNGYEAFRWTASGGMTGLGDLTGSWFESSANAVSGDGGVVVGFGRASNGYQAFRWKEGTGFGNGMWRVSDLLAADNIALGDWVLLEATGVSDNGEIISGYGVNPDGDIEAWRALVGTGMVSMDNLSGSLGLVGGTVASAHREAGYTVEVAMEVARHMSFDTSEGEMAASIDWENLRFAAGDLTGLTLTGLKSGEWSSWGVLTTIQGTDDPAGSDALTGTLGFSWKGSQGLRYGFGGHVGENELEPGGQGQESERSVVGVNGYVAWEPAHSPERIYAALGKTWLEDDIVRPYLNGVTPVISEGEREGESLGFSTLAGWVHHLDENRTLMPFAEYALTRIKLDAWAEQSGPFPAQFDEVRHTSRVLKLGLEGVAPVGDGFDGWASVAWAHDFNSDLPDINGVIVPLASGFSVNGIVLDDDWAEVRAGVKGTVTDKVGVSLSVRSSFGGDEEAVISGFIGFSARL